MVLNFKIRAESFKKFLQPFAVFKQVSFKIEKDGIILVSQTPEYNIRIEAIIPPRYFFEYSLKESFSGILNLEKIMNFLSEDISGKWDKYFLIIEKNQENSKKTFKQPVLTAEEDYELELEPSLVVEHTNALAGQLFEDFDCQDQISIRYRDKKLILKNIVLISSNEIEIEWTNITKLIGSDSTNLTIVYPLELKKILAILKQGLLLKTNFDQRALQLQIFSEIHYQITLVTVIEE